MNDFVKNQRIRKVKKVLLSIPVASQENALQGEIVTKAKVVKIPFFYPPPNLNFNILTFLYNNWLHNLKQNHAAIH